MENDERTNAFASVMCRRRHVTGLEGNPETEEWTAGALDLYVNQEEEIELPKARFAFYPQSSWFKNLVTQCRIRELTDKFAELRKGGLGKVASARRLMTSTFRAPAFEVRCGKSFNLEKFLRGGGILILEGGPGVSFDAMRTIMGAVILKVIDYVRNRSRPEPRVRLVIDEAANADLLGMFECRAMAETQKMGLDFSVLVQNLNFGNSAVTDGVLQNCLRHEWFYCANEAVARAGAADLGDSSYKDKLMTLSRGVRM
jgi:hypothetical protein